MAQNAEQIRVGQTGSVWTAPAGTSFPTGVAEAPGVGWVDHGLTTTDGVTVSFGRETKKLYAWQVRDAVRTLITAEPKTVKFALMQLNYANWQLALGGGSTASDGADGYVYTPPEEGSRDERALIVEFVDGEFTYRLCYRRAENESGIETNVNAEAEVGLPLTMAVNSDPAGSWFLQTNDPDFAGV